MSQGPEKVEYPWLLPTCFNLCKREGAPFMLQGTYAKLQTLQPELLSQPQCPLTVLS